MPKLQNVKNVLVIGSGPIISAGKQNLTIPVHRPAAH